jgi:hypothetical protein
MCGCVVVLDGKTHLAHMSDKAPGGRPVGAYEEQVAVAEDADDQGGEAMASVYELGGVSSVEYTGVGPYRVVGEDLNAASLLGVIQDSAESAGCGAGP